MMNNKKRKGRHSDLKDFQRGPSGEYIYTGKIYRYLGPGSLKRALARQLLLAVIAAVAIILPGCVITPGMQDCPYVLVPYVGEVICGVITAWGLGSFFFAQKEIRAYVYDKTIRWLPVRMTALILFTTVGIVVETIYLVQNGERGMVGGAVLLYTCKVVTIAVTLLQIRQLKGMQWSQG